MISKGTQYLTAAGFGNIRVTAASMGPLDILGTCWLRDATMQAIMVAFGADGAAVIRATNAYLNGIAATDKSKAQALAALINEDPMMVCSLGLSVEGITMPIRWIAANGNVYINSGYIFSARKLRYEFMYRKRTNLNYSTGGVDYSSSPRRLHGLLWGTYFFVGSSRWGVTQSLNTWYNTTIRITDNASYIKLNTTEYNFGISDWNGCSDEDFIFAGNRGGSPVYMAYMDLQRMEFFDENDNQVRWFLPFQTNKEWAAADCYPQKVCARGTVGLIDVITGKFYPSVNNNTFGMSYERGGQPWTPPTP